MNTAEQVKAFAVAASEADSSVHVTTAAIEEGEKRGEATQDFDNESTEFDFPDGSVMVVCNNEVFCYGSR